MKKKYSITSIIKNSLSDNENWGKMWRNPNPKKHYDVIIVVNYLYRPKIKKLINLLKKDGFLFYETFSLGNEKYGSPKDPKFLLKDRELIEIFGEFLLPLSFYDGRLNDGKIAIKQRASFKKGVL